MQINQKISKKEKVGYSLGDVSANLVFQMLMIYQLKFYTDVFGLDGAVAGSVLLFAPLASLFIDPIVGIVTDRTQTKWGKYRPWLLWTALPFSVFYILAFWNPGIQDKTLVAIYATTSYVLLLAAYGFNNNPYASLGGVMTNDIRERTNINKVRFIFTTIAQFIVQGFTLPLVDRFGQGDDARGWTCTITLYAVMAFFFLLVAFVSTKERISPPPRQKMSVKADVKETFSNVAWRVLFVLTLLLFVTLSMNGSSMNFYFQSFLDGQSICDFFNIFGVELEKKNAYSMGFSVFNIVNAVVQFIGVLLLSEYLANRFGKKSTFIVCLSLTALFTALFYLPSSEDIALVYILCLLKSLAYSPTVPLLWAMVADAADYMEYQNHRRATGFCFSGIMLALKSGLGVGAAFAGLILSAFGYVSGGVVVQSDTAVQGIRLVSSIIPALLFMGGVVALLFYPITKDFNEKMQNELTSRRRLTISKR